MPRDGGGAGLPAEIPLDAPQSCIGIDERVAWSFEIGALLDGSMRPSHLESGSEAVRETVEYLQPIVRERRSDPRHDLISRLGAAQDDGDAPTEIELVATCVLLLGTGHEKTALLLGNAVAALLAHPDQLRRLREDPSLGTLAVEEFLRFDGPVQAISRVPDCDLESAGTQFRRNAVVNILLGAVNHDSTQFADGDRLDIGRTKNSHLAFGATKHACPGAAMARLVCRLTVEQILKRFPRLTIGPGDPVRRPLGLVRGFTSLPVQI